MIQEQLQPPEAPITQPCPVCNQKDEDCPVCDGTGEVENIPEPDDFNEVDSDDERYPETVNEK